MATLSIASATATTVVVASVTDIVRSIGDGLSGGVRAVRSGIDQVAVSLAKFGTGVVFGILIDASNCCLAIFRGWPDGGALAAIEFSLVNNEIWVEELG